jgi:hypothetical protein
MALLVAPVLLGIAWSGWLKTVRASLPPWRNGAALAALLLASLDWAAAALVHLSTLLVYDTQGVLGFKWLVFLLWSPLLILALLLALALRGAPRALTVAALFLMLLGWRAVVFTYPR